jgi:hypothetical protein
VNDGRKSIQNLIAIVRNSKVPCGVNGVVVNAVHAGLWLSIAGKRE